MCDVILIVGAGSFRKLCKYPLLVKQPPLVTFHVLCKKLSIRPRPNVAGGQTQYYRWMGADSSNLHQLLAEPCQDNVPQPLAAKQLIPALALEFPTAEFDTW